MYVLDTDHLSLIPQHGGAADTLRSRMAALGPKTAVATIVSFEEQMRGWMANLAWQDNLPRQIRAYRQLQDVLDRYNQIPVLPFDDAAADRFERLRKLRLRVGTMDMKIAAIALAHDATVLTRNLRDFERIPSLRVEDWTK